MSYRCTECGFGTGKWMGFCPQCRTHGSLGAVGAASVGPVPVADAVSEKPAQRRRFGITEVDRVLGGGLVAGSVVLVGGEPGVGKSTLLLQIAAALAADTSAQVLYVSGEESTHQIGIRAARLGVVAPNLSILAETDVAAIEAVVDATSPALVVIDSIQTCRSPEVDGSPGAVNQVRACGAQFATLARGSGVPVMLVGHVTKDGGLAGPKVLEHVVDVVLYLEGDPDRGLRYLRSLKNRHGSVDQVGVFEMTGAGMRQVADPSGIFMDGWSGGVPGTVVYPALYGRRSLLVEIQALVSPSNAPQPRRSVKGIEAARVHQLLAVLERHGGISCADHEVYVNVVGGVTIRDPAADLPVALAVASARLELPLGTVAAFGEVGLTGEVRSVAHRDRRSAEARRFGLGDVVTAAEAGRLGVALAAVGLDTLPVRSVAAAG